MASAVTNFNRFPRLMQGVWRCLGLARMYFDDMTAQDLASACGDGQRGTRELFALIGRSLHQRKTLDMTAQQDFRVLEHDHSGTIMAGCVRLNPREPPHQDLLPAMERAPTVMVQLEHGRNRGVLVYRHLFEGEQRPTCCVRRCEAFPPQPPLATLISVTEGFSMMLELVLTRCPVRSSFSRGKRWPARQRKEAKHRGAS